MKKKNSLRWESVVNKRFGSETSPILQSLPWGPWLYVPSLEQLGPYRPLLSQSSDPFWERNTIKDRINNHSRCRSWQGKLIFQKPH